MDYPEKDIYIYIKRIFDLNCHIFLKRVQKKRILDSDTLPEQYLYAPESLRNRMEQSHINN